ncbi:MAG TPA: 30S ribosomal protein S6 [Candidatus Paceibacterota bacterium]|nr:30S ribosomal protein S6 [Candidatus Paceibacterota bacterium]
MSKSEETKTELQNGTLIYEAGFHIFPTASASEVKEIVEAIKTEVARVGGEVISEEEPAKIKLAYEMRKNTASKRYRFTESYFGWVKFEGEAETALKMDEFLKHHESILRFIIVKTIREDTFYRKGDEEENDFQEEGSDTEHSSETEVEEEKNSEEKTDIDEEELDKSIERLTT